MADNAKTKEKQSLGARISGFFKGVRAEFKKIIWPDRDSLIREVIAVIVVSVILCLLIAVLDSVISTGIGFLMK